LVNLRSQDFGFDGDLYRLELQAPGARDSILEGLEDRPLAVGSKNWLFAGSDTGGKRAAVMYTIIKTTKLNSVNVEAYLTDLLAHIRRRLPGFLFLQDPNDLLFRELSLPHRPPPDLRTLPKSGGVSGAQVSIGGCSCQTPSTQNRPGEPGSA
jgi:hypothetical protein